MALLLSRGQTPSFKWRPTQFEQGASFTLPAPYGGLNLRDDITALQPNEARVLENWFPGSGQVELRPGFAAHANSLGSGEVKTLATFSGYTASRLIACANGKQYNATTAGAATEIATGLSQDRWQTALYSNRLFFVNGSDTPRVYDGSTSATIAWSGSGLTNTNLINIALVRNRLWFCENNAADVWYAGVGQITSGAALTKFQLSQVASGGTCTAIGAWSRDGGAGPDDLIVFVMSTGEVIVYQGDPASTFTLIGKYPAQAAPIGRQCLFQVGGELVVITRLGLLPLSAAVGGVALDLARIDPWGKIAPTIVSDALLHGGKAGWHGCLHNGVVYINVPLTEGALSKQHVLNTRNGAWCTFTGWNGSAFASFDNSLYFGAQTGGVVRKVEGANDSGTSITAISSGAFVYPTQSQLNNVFTAIRPKMQAEGSVAGLVGVDTDFILRTLIGDSVNIINDPSTTPWGSDWGSPWGRRGEARPLWYSITGEGRAVSVRLLATASTADLRWYASDLLYRPGGIR